jgi:prepilin peptidase CpaA
MILTLFLLVFYFDLEYRIIPNAISIGFIILGYTVSFISGGNILLLQSILGSIIGLSILLIPYAKGGVGGGDVKLLAALGSLTTISFLMQTIFLGLLLASLLSLIALYKNKKLMAVWNFLIGTLTPIHKNPKPSQLYIPLGACFSIVGIILLFNSYTGGG